MIGNNQNHVHNQAITLTNQMINDDQTTAANQAMINTQGNFQIS